MRLSGKYDLKSDPICQADYQIKPCSFVDYEGWSLPVSGPFTLAKAERGTAVLYVSSPGETPLDYTAKPHSLHWSEQRFELPSSAKRINAGEIVIWEPGYLTTQTIDNICVDKIRDNYPVVSAYEEYTQLILDAVNRRLVTCPQANRVAVAQSGGLDSLLIVWALHTLGVKVYPLTVCTSPNDLDITAATACLQRWGLKPISIVVENSQAEELLKEAITCLEDTETSNLRMAIGNLLMAKKCQELGVQSIFTGHGHDDIHGKGTLVKAALKQIKGKTESERWAIARKNVTLATGGMLKMFASTFRSYGIHVRHPYYDRDLLNWAFSQPVSIIPATFDKSFVRDFATTILPSGEWLNKKHSVGYLTGAGLNLKQPLLKKNPLFTPELIRRFLLEIKGSIAHD
ncbi:asnB, asparagine synthase [Nostoc flagelliforme CCNUN1]|uniref:asparagine synthase (glutamine-hydrolyzing) n=1 Tax=Nostoc flagelliforme CCNUN1 TaxID=2038116 RepID=A0A2K8SPZ4_9NOSO|nr:asparagine synthase-related protein [Nostoc flagelliforme]AUB37478.1 asnB, asparagine synthase [Nostoc flagelliforme CCNUN1]